MQGGAVVSLPRLEIREDEDEKQSSNGAGVSTTASSADVTALMPGLGASSHHSAAAALPGDRMEMPPPPPQIPTAGGAPSMVRIPKMAASVFGDSSPGSKPDAATAATAAGTARAQSLAAARAGTAGPGNVASVNADATRLEQVASRNMGRKTTWTRSSAPQAPPALLQSLRSSFGSLVDSRVRAWTLLLLRHSLNSGDSASRSRLLALLATGASIDMTAVTTTFVTLELPRETKARLDAEHRKKREEMRASAVERGTVQMSRTPGEGGDENRDVVLPLIFEAVVDVNIQGQEITVKLRAPGTISGKFNQVFIALR